MPNSKQINELTQASSVNSTDQLPLAQSGSNEAVRATVSQLASAVGELNQTGALSELELATSLGKNLLAQNLTEKGVPTSPSETLISMANKVNNLQTTENKSLIVSGLSTTSTQYSYNTEGVGYGIVSSVCLKNGYTALASNGKMYFCDTENDYSEFQDFLDKAYSNVDLGFTDTMAHLIPSSTGSYIAVLQGKEYDKVDIYSVDYTNKVFTFSKTVTLPSTYSNYCAVGINSDASLIAWVNNTGSSARAYMMLASDSNSAVQLPSMTYFTSHSQLQFDTELDSIYLYVGTGASSNYNKLTKVDYSISGSTITTTSQYSTQYSGMSYGLKLCPYTNQAVVHGTSYSVANYAYSRISAYIIDLRTGYSTNSCDIELKYNWTETYSSSLSSYELAPCGLFDCPVIVEENYIKYHFLVPEGYLKYDKRTGIVSFEYGDLLRCPKPLDFFARTQGTSPNYYYKTSVSFFDSKKEHAFVGGEWAMNFFKIVDIVPNQVVGLIRCNNGYATEHYRQYYSKEEIENGQFSFYTTDVVIPEESEESN